MILIINFDVNTLNSQIEMNNEIERTTVKHTEFDCLISFVKHTFSHREISVHTMKKLKSTHRLNA